jgi:predicted transcriptional regulator
MDIKTLKSEIYRKIDELDEEQLFQVNEMVTAYLKQTNEEEQWDTLSDEDKAAIEEGISQIERGEFYTHEEVMKMIHREFGF